MDWNKRTWHREPLRAHKMARGGKHDGAARAAEKIVISIETCSEFHLSCSSSPSFVTHLDGCFLPHTESFRANTELMLATLAASGKLTSRQSLCLPRARTFAERNKWFALLRRPAANATAETKSETNILPRNFHYIPTEHGKHENKKGSRTRIFTFYFHLNSAAMATGGAPFHALPLSLSIGLASEIILQRVVGDRMLPLKSNFEPKRNKGRR